MRSLFFLFFFLVLACDGPADENAANRSEQEAIVLGSFDGLRPYLKENNDTTYVINFWATSCPPCIREMPYFETLREKYADHPLQVLLVSLDRPRQLEGRVNPFIRKMELQSKVFLLADPDYSAWTQSIDPSWYGALPATLIVGKDRRKFHFGAFPNYHELETAYLEARSVY